MSDRETFYETETTTVDFLELRVIVGCHKLPKTRTSAFKFDFQQAACVQKWMAIRSELELTSAGDHRRQWLMVELDNARRDMNALIESISNSIAHSLVHSVGEMLEKEMFG